MTANPNISNGTCYYAENTLTKGDFVPCGNDAIQAWPCCKLGSFCLSLGDANACWDAKSGNTYVAGCTDPSFTSPNCARKPPTFHEQEWVPINQACKDLNANSKATNVTNWTGCVAPEDSTDIIKIPLSSCTPYCDLEHVVYAGSASLPAFASLPTLAGSSIFWQNNFVPPTTAAPGYTPGTPADVVGTFTPTATSAPPGDSSDSGLSPAAKAGVGVGAAVGGLLTIFAIAGLFILCFRRRRQRKDDEALAAGPGYDRYPPTAASETGTYPHHGGGPGGGGYLSPGSAAAAVAGVGDAGQPSPPPPFTTGTYPYHYQQAPSQDAMAGHAAAYGTAYKSELPADERYLPAHSPQHSVSVTSAAGSPVPVSSIAATPASAYGTAYSDNPRK